MSKKAFKDLKRLRSTNAYEKVKKAIEEDLRTEPHPQNLDIKFLKANKPWMRMRVGSHRVLFRPLSKAELAKYSAKRGFAVERIIDRKELETVIAKLRLSAKRRGLISF